MELFNQDIPQPCDEVVPLVIRANVGYNKNSTTTNHITYTWYAAKEGVFIFHDMGGHYQQRKRSQYTRSVWSNHRRSCRVHMARPTNR